MTKQKNIYLKKVFELLINIYKNMKKYLIKRQTCTIKWLELKLKFKWKRAVLWYSPGSDLSAGPHMDRLLETWQKAGGLRGVAASVLRVPAERSDPGEYHSTAHLSHTDTQVLLFTAWAHLSTHTRTRTHMHTCTHSSWKHVDTQITHKNVIALDQYISDIHPSKCQLM